MKQTSRNWLIDSIEYIWQLLAYCSHLQELVDSYWENDEITIEDYQFAIEWIKSATVDRRQMMQKIMDDYKGNNKLWCAVKHSIFAYTLATELLYADMNNTTFRQNQKSASIRMYSTISAFIGADIVSCWRCLSEQLDKEEVK
jgi:hypothetical protein